MARTVRPRERLARRPGTNSVVAAFHIDRRRRSATVQRPYLHEEETNRPAQARQQFGALTSGTIGRAGPFSRRVPASSLSPTTSKSASARALAGNADARRAHIEMPIGEDDPRPPAAPPPPARQRRSRHNLASWPPMTNDE